MPPKILRRCTACGKFHAAYLVEDTSGGRQHLCYACWKARQDVESLKKPPEPDQHLDSSRQDGGEKK
ncbi:MAG TPA: hypothetical protein VIO61_02065 [Anaerolineaceae bacterium]